MRKTLFRCFAIAGAVLVSAFAYAQTSRTVTGTVSDSGGYPLPGVNVVIQGTATGTITNVDGVYSLEVPNPENSALLFSYIGFQQETVAIGNLTTIDVVLENDFVGLDEVVAIGYGVVRRKDLTGSVGSVDAEEIEKVTSSNAMQAIQGKVPGVDIQQSSGEAGSGVNINLRGNRSLTASNSPLILVDGIEYGSTLDINPSDIESMDVLKDASSTAIYGSRGANGVILITTKRGQAGVSNVTFKSFMSTNMPTNVPQVMYGRKEVQRLIDRANYAADEASGNWGDSNLLVEEVLTESGEDFSEMDVYDNNSYTDWLDMILQDGTTQNYEVSITGGEKNTTFSLSSGAMFEEGLMKNDQLGRYNGRLSVDHKVNDYFKTGASMLLTYRDHDARNASVFGQALKMTSIAHPYTEDGEIIESPNPRYAAHVNPLLDEVDGAYSRNTESTRLFGNYFVEITPFEGLLFRSNFGFDLDKMRRGTYQDFLSVARAQTQRTSYISYENQSRHKYTWENVLTYDTDFDNGRHTLTAMLGQSMDQTIYEQSMVQGDAGPEHYYNSTFYDLTKIAQLTPPTSDWEKINHISYFGRVNYQLDNKYLLTVSMRADGSSPLASDNKWSSFPSVSGAWRVSEESFMEGTRGMMTNLKLRASWGITGNSAIEPYQTLGTLSTRQSYYFIDGRDIAFNIPDNYGNDQLKWETTEAINLGVDFGFANNRISGNIDVWSSNTYDLLYFKSAPPSETYPSIIDNIGETKATGLEIGLNTAVVRNSFITYNINWSYSTFTDEVVAIGEGLTKNQFGREAHIVGEPVSVFYDYEADGNWDVGEFDAYLAAMQDENPDFTSNYISNYGMPGSIKIIDRNNDGQLDDEDKITYNRSPKHILGMNNNVTIGDFDLSVLVYARLGGYIEYGMNSQLNFESANWGDLDYWTLDNKDAKFPNPGTESSTHANYGSSLLYEKANYVKIRDVTLGYSLPTNVIGNIGLTSVRVYGSLKNYFTFSDIDNYDPERGGSINFPLAKQMVFGLSVQF
ncbi:SusC/RagA family TonB-linked outer membrane protein [Geofilum rubicundum]|uniref:TonB-dependent receptor n=1 Tax=Geofilum rubicundum JCM 15548 TaxID=1236989 RepID=A0A0E9M0J8_9BACT|nr:TonB-dependent receptor [Geofilum rubicundum]GAO31357.1 TonB-dependent receptor [Geofilum rubicundum JCM 15548]